MRKIVVTDLFLVFKLYMKSEQVVMTLATIYFGILHFGIAIKTNL